MGRIRCFGLACTVLVDDAVISIYCEEVRKQCFRFRNNGGHRTGDAYIRNTPGQAIIYPKYDSVISTFKSLAISLATLVIAAQVGSANHSSSLMQLSNDCVMASKA
jgi:hypothetical protein